MSPRHRDAGVRPAAANCSAQRNPSRGPAGDVRCDSIGLEGSSKPGQDGCWPYNARISGSMPGRSAQSWRGRHRQRIRAEGWWRRTRRLAVALLAACPARLTGWRGRSPAAYRARGFEGQLETTIAVLLPLRVAKRSRRFGIAQVLHSRHSCGRIDALALEPPRMAATLSPLASVALSKYYVPGTVRSGLVAFDTSRLAMRVPLGTRLHELQGNVEMKHWCTSCKAKLR
jgi:hypothetical protein